MKKYILGIIIFSLLIFSIFADTYYKPSSVILIKELSKADFARSDSVTPFMIPPIVDQNGLLNIVAPGNRILVYTSDFKRKEIGKILDFSFGNPFESEGSYINGDRLFGISFEDGFCIVRNSGKYTALIVRTDERSQYLFSINKLVLFNENYDSKRYVSYVIEKDDTYTSRNHEETLDYVKKNIPELKVNGELIYFKDNPLNWGNIAQVDDDGNFYEARTVARNGHRLATIESPPEERLKYETEFFDTEGNLWQIDFTKDKTQYAVFHYVGRDWGYKAVPKKAQATSDGQIRLRATSDGYLLGQLTKGQAITILKTGDKATIGGVTAPWYRIKTADGLIGWAFGGGIQVAQ